MLGWDAVPSIISSATQLILPNQRNVLNKH